MFKKIYVPTFRRDEKIKISNIIGFFGYFYFKNILYLLILKVRKGENIGGWSRNRPQSQQFPESI